jgi:Ala-tRNA(Pro) deacylase
VSFSSLKAAAGVANVDLADEDEFKDRFPDCELGAMPPFGNLYGMQVYVAKTLTYDKEIAFNAGSHAELVKLAYADYERLVDPTVIEL